MAIIMFHSKQTTDEGKLKFGGSCHTSSNKAEMEADLRKELLIKLDLATVDELKVENGDFHGLGTPN